MARVFGIQGNVTGKIANTIYAVVKGVNVARAYNPEPANPQTASQVESRAKLKLLSQMAKQLAPIIAFRPQGLVSARNMFVKANYDKTSYDNDVASLEMYEIDLTGGVIDLGVLSVDLVSSSLNADVTNGADGVKVVVFGATAVTSQGAIHVFPVQVKTEASGTPGRFVMDPISVGSYDNFKVFAYGIRFNNEGEFAKYEQMLVSAAGSSSLNVLKKLDYTNTSLTNTKFAEIAVS